MYVTWDLLRTYDTNNNNNKKQLPKSPNKLFLPKIFTRIESATLSFEYMRSAVRLQSLKLLLHIACCFYAISSHMSFLNAMSTVRIIYTSCVCFAFFILNDIANITLCSYNLYGSVYVMINELDLFHFFFSFIKICVWDHILSNTVQQDFSYVLPQIFIIYSTCNVYEYYEFGIQFDLGKIRPSVIPCTWHGGERWGRAFNWYLRN